MYIARSPYRLWQGPPPRVDCGSRLLSCITEKLIGQGFHEGASS